MVGHRIKVETDGAGDAGIIVARSASIHAPAGVDDANIGRIQKYIFPGGMLPSEAALKPIIQSADLASTGIERFGHSYADTLKRWDERFMGAWDQIQRMGFDDRFRRLWRFYLAYCEAGFRSDRINVVQLALSRA